MRALRGRALVLLIALLAGAAAPDGRGAGAGARGLLSRHYREGEALTYRMTGANEGWTYEIQASGIVKRDAAGVYFEEYGWSGLQSNQPITLSAASLSFRQIVSLDLSHPDPKYLSIPDLSRVDPALVGPITDLLTFYADWLLAARQKGLLHPGDRAYVKKEGANSWADGHYVILGQDAIDFDIQLAEVTDAEHTAVLLVRHVPPATPGITIPVAWMREPVGAGPNNWVEVRKARDGRILAGIGRETFDVRMTVGVEEGQILQATLTNRVDESGRTCADASLKTCGDPERHLIERRIELKLVH